MLDSLYTVDGTLVTKLSRGSEKRVLLVCDKCGKKNTTAYANYYRSQTSRNWSGETICRSCSSAASAPKRCGRPAWNKGKTKPPEERVGRPYIGSDGYRLVFKYKPDVKSKWELYVKEHLSVMEEAIGRPLKENEVVHHIDGDKLNNDIDNLHLTTGAGHRLIHVSLDEIAYHLVQVGLLLFNNGIERYVMSSELKDLIHD